MTARFCHLWTKKKQHWKPTAHHMLEERLYLTVCVTMSQLKRYKWETLSERGVITHIFRQHCQSLPFWDWPLFLLKETQGQACGGSSSVVPYRNPKLIYQHFSSISHDGYKSLTCYSCWTRVPKCSIQHRVCVRFVLRGHAEQRGRSRSLFTRQKQKKALVSLPLTLWHVQSVFSQSMCMSHKHQHHSDSLWLVSV